MKPNDPKRCILVVEDDDDIRETLRALLEMEEYEVTTAINGKEGLNCLRTMSNPPCLILLDLMMPVMTGWEFMDYRKSDVVLATIPVVVVSAATGEKSTPPGAVSYIKKPIELNSLLDAVEKYCKRA